MAEAVGAVAESVTVVAVVGGLVVAFGDFKWLIPWVGAGGAGGAFALITKGIDPMLAVGGAVTVGSFVFPPIQMIYGPQGWTGESEMEGVKGISQLMLGGTTFAIAHMATKSLPVSAALALGAGIVAPKLFWNSLLNFYIDMGTFGPAKCTNAESPGGPAQCASACHNDVQKAAAVALLARPPCSNSNDPVMIAWCKAKAKQLETCPFPKQMALDPGPQPGKASNCSVPHSPECNAYGVFSRKEPPTFPSNKIQSSVPCSVGHWGLTEGIPITGNEWYAAFGPNSMNGLSFVSPGVLQVEKTQNIPAGKYSTPPDTATVLVAGNTYLVQTFWGLNGLCGKTVPYISFEKAASLKPGQTRTYLYTKFTFDGKNPYANSHLAGPWKGRSACAPAIGSVTPDGKCAVVAQVHFNATQPLSGDMNQFCKGKTQRVQTQAEQGGKYLYNCSAPGGTFATGKPAAGLPFPAIK